MWSGVGAVLPGFLRLFVALLLVRLVFWSWRRLSLWSRLRRRLRRG